MNEQELNRRLAEWAGFYSLSHMGQTDIDREEYQVDLYDPNRKQIHKLPSFTQSLDACFKWLGGESHLDRILMKIREELKRGEANDTNSHEGEQI